jgi:hypothetical protein
VALVVLADVVVVPETTCNTFPPPAGATHLSPVASTLSATMLQLGKGIVLSTIVCDCG